MNQNEELKKQINELDEQRGSLAKKSDWLIPVALIVPIFTVILTLVNAPELTFFVGGISAAFSGLMYYFAVSLPFNHLKQQVRTSLLKEFMAIYHPNIDYHYQPEKNKVKQIINASGLVRCNQYHEEDVITGTANNINFYLSEINLKTSSGKSTTTVFKGILFKIKIPGRNFPTAQIQSKPGLLKKMFSNFTEKPKFGFWYDTQNPHKFHEKLGAFFPFIRHLIQQQKDIRIKTEGDEITILMKSDMKFLDDPKPQLNRSFKDELYYQKLGQQVNSLLFIVEAFAGKLDKQEVIERLELKELEYLKLGLEDNLQGRDNE